MIALHRVSTWTTIGLGLGLALTGCVILPMDGTGSDSTDETPAAHENVVKKKTKPDGNMSEEGNGATGPSDPSTPGAQGSYAGPGGGPAYGPGGGPPGAVIYAPGSVIVGANGGVFTGAGFVPGAGVVIGGPGASSGYRSASWVRVCGLFGCAFW